MNIVMDPIPQSLNTSFISLKIGLQYASSACGVMQICGGPMYEQEAFPVRVMAHGTAPD